MTQNETTLDPRPRHVSLTLPAKGQLWTGRVLGLLAVAFMLFDAIGKIILPVQVVQASAQLGYKASTLPAIGIALLACTILYIIPRTSVLGAMLMTGYLGGAVASMVRIGAPTFELIFPILFASILWISLWLRTPQLRSLFPLIQK